MGHTFLCVLSFCWLNILFCGETQAVEETGAKATVTADRTVIPAGGSVTLTCSVQDPTVFKYDWFRETSTSNKDFYKEAGGSNRVSVSQGGIYTCRGQRNETQSVTHESDPVTIEETRFAETGAKATVTADRTVIPAGGSVTLTCSVQDPTVFKYHWFRKTSTSNKDFYNETHGSNRVSVSQGGIYTCRGLRNERSVTPESDSVTIEETVPDEATVTLQPNWPLIYRGETITVRCEIQGGGRTEWTYEWKPDKLDGRPTHNEYRITAAAESDSGKYSCRGRNDYLLTEWSKVITLTVSANTPNASLRADSAVIPAEGSVTLTCSVDGSEGWRYSWFRRSSESSAAQTIRDDAAQSTVSISEGGIYHCRGRRGNIFSENSRTVMIDKTVSNRVTVTLQPSWSQIFVGESVIVRCEIQDPGHTGWKYEWQPTNVRTSPTQNQIRISEATLSHSGDYRCRAKGDFYVLTEWSNVVTLTVSHRRPKAQLIADDTVIPAGGSVTLTCSVKPSSGWKYHWYRGDTSSEVLTGQDAVSQSPGQISVSQEGLYWCRGRRGDPVYYTEDSDSVTIYKYVPNRAVVTLQPSWSQLFRGETITLRCEIMDGANTEWEYDWKTTNSLKPPTQHEYKIRPVLSSANGEYRCKGRSKGSQSLTKWSDATTLTVSDYKPKPVLTVSPSWLSPGASVTLNCEVEHPSAGWRFYWYKAVPKLPGDSYSYELLPGSSSGTEQDSYMVHGQTHTAGYVCKARRGDPLYYTLDSELKLVWSGDAVLTLEPSWSTFFTGESVSFICDMNEGKHTDWEYKINKDGREFIQYNSYKKYTLQPLSTAYSGEYQCFGWQKSSKFVKHSNKVTLSVSDRPRATVRPGTTTIPVGGSVTLTCSVDDSDGWKYDWFRRTSDFAYGDIMTESTNREIRVSKGGIYRCRGGRGKPVFYTDPSADVTIEITFSNMVTVTQQHDWPQIFSGETITVRCEIQGAGDTEWDYEWRTPRPTTHRTHVNIWTFRASESSSGDYMCKGRLRGDWYSSTKWSEATTVTVSHQPKPVLTVSPSWLSPGASVTLDCEVEHPSAGWRFYWYKAVPKLPSDSYSYELLPGNSSGTEQDSYMVHGQTHTAGYVCRARRGDPVFYTQDSELKLVWSADVDPAASLTVSPDRVQHFTSESVSLSCEGNSTEWRVRRFPEDRSLSCPFKWRMTGSTCKISSSQSSAAVYWCESGSGEFSNSVNITLQNDIILLSPVLPVTEGDPVSLSCKLRTENLRFNVEFYKNDKLVQNDTRLELNISAVSKSDEGFYRCKVMKESAQSWVSVKLSRREQDSSFLVPLITGLVCGLFLLILLMLLFCYKKSKGWGPTRSQSTNQSPAMDHMINQQEAQHEYASVNDDTCLYESVKSPEGAENDEPSEVTYSLIKLKNVAKKEKTNEAEESCVYSEVKTGSAADDNQLYAQIRSHNKAKAKKKKRKPSPEDETV